jgi:phospholipid/cholesterol/gamma-HCH transport system ATP-binding protein
VRPLEAAGSARPPAIELRDVSISFDGEHDALHSVSLSLPAGHLLVVTGNSGSGKSVLLRVVAGLLRPDEGEVVFDGRHIEGLGEDDLLALRSATLGFVSQEDSLFSGLSVYDNTAFRLVEHGWSEEATDRTVREILAFVGLADDAEKLPEELSIGMRRRLELARALSGWPPIMLYDEATSGLDPITAKNVMDLIIRARDVNGVSSIYVTKELHEIPYLAGHFAAAGEDGEIRIHEGHERGAATVRVLVLDCGEVGFLGSPEEFAASELPSVLAMTRPELGHAITLEDLRRGARPSDSR